MRNAAGCGRFSIRLKPPKDVGFIIRTAGVGKTKTEIQRDLTYLTRLWTNFVKKRDSGPGPMELYTEGDLVTRTVRDVFTSDIDRIVVDNKEVAKRVKEVIKLANPRTKNKVELYEEPGSAVPQVRHRARNRADVQPARAAAQRRIAGDRLHRGDRRHRRQQRQIPRAQPTPKPPPSRPTWKPPTKSPASSASAIWAA